METHLREQREGYESKLEALVFKNDHLSRENQQLQALFQEKSDVNHSIGQEVARLTAENMVLYISVLYSHFWSSWWGERLECEVNDWKVLGQGKQSSAKALRVCGRMSPSFWQTLFKSQNLLKLTYLLYKYILLCKNLSLLSLGKSLCWTFFVACRWSLNWSNS